MRESRFRPDAGIVTVRTTGSKADSEAGRIVIHDFRAHHTGAQTGVGERGGRWVRGLRGHGIALPEAVRALFLGRRDDEHCLAYKRSVRRWS